MSHLPSPPAEPVRQQRSRKWFQSIHVLPFLVLAAFLAATYYLWKNEQQNAMRDLQTRFDFRVRDAQYRVEQRMKIYEQVMRGVNGLFSHADTVRRSEFHDYIAMLKLAENYPGIQGVGFAQVVPRTEKDRHVASIRRQGFPAYTITPGGERDIYTAVIYIEPFDERNRRALGYDMYSDHDHPRSGDASPGMRQTAMKRARDSGKASISGKVRLLMELESDKNPQAGFLMYLPVYQHGLPHNNIAERRANIVGWIYAPFRVNNLMAGILGEIEDDIDIEIFDDGEMSDSALLYDSNNVRAGIAHSKALFRSSGHLHIADNTWVMAAHSLPGFEALLDRDKPRIIALSGVGAGILSALLTWMLLYGRTRAQRASLAIGQELAERKLAEQALRASEERFRSVFDFSKVGINVLGQNYEYLKVNKAFCEMTGYSEGELLAHDFKGITHPDDVEPNMRLRRKLLAGEIDFFHMEKRYIRKSGDLLWGDLTVSAVRDENRNFLSGVAIIQDITERKQAEEKLLKLSRAVENSPASVVITDVDGAIEYVNNKFTSVSGYSLGEVVGQNPRIFSSGRQPKEFYKKMWTDILAGKEWQGEIHNKKKDGEIYLEHVSISPILNEHNVVTHFVAIKEDITEKKKSEELIWKQANFDTLTGLPNRRMFRDRLEQEIKKAFRASSKLALLFIDLDRFKEINDSMGHDMGDTLLVEAARRIGDCARATDMVARLGGDEFTVILAELDEISSVERVAQCIIQELSKPFQLGNEAAYVSASIGITLYPNDAAGIEELLKNADQAMYVAKNEGRNRHSYFTPMLQEAAQKRLRLINDLRNALAASQFRVYFQPIVDLGTGRINKAEALIRWQHPERGLVSPAEFIPLAEETGLIFEVGDWVFHESVRWVKRWRELYNGVLQISVNKSPVQFYKDGTKHSAWLSYLQLQGMPGQCLAIEITEGLLMSSDSPVTGALLTLRDAGIQVSIDDFGTGYSSLSYLKKFDIDYLKIDQSFTRNLAPGSSDMALSEAIIMMAHKLGLKVVAEGVETEEQRDLLAMAGCDYGQGYLYSRPVSAEDFEILLKENCSDRAIIL